MPPPLKKKPVKLKIGMKYGSDYALDYAHTWEVIALRPKRVVVERNDGVLITHSYEFVEGQLAKYPKYGLETVRDYD